MSNSGTRNEIVTVDIDKELYQRLKDKASSKRYQTKKYINEMLKLLLDKEEFLQRIAPQINVSGYEGNRVDLLDMGSRELVAVLLHANKLYCSKDRTTDCIHTWYVWAIPELAHLTLATPDRELFPTRKRKGQR